ncbi:hypothetical protein GCM10022226_54980 [Sphaerisporangium flaviroseum]|uniref:Sigma-70 family RNA polymerase sigma factor n=1 Tax=Sphaerisporangium flaviroseum TaxID=509199 RepID=A0ABP7IU55_9ACTN
MPGWPSVGRADDQRLVEALRRADGRAADSLYDSYADRLNDYAYSLLHDTDTAADSVHDAIVTAHGRVGALREPARFRAWLYALTRFQCATRRGRTPANGTELEQYLGVHEEDPELAATVREALAELGVKEREVLLLALRHELSTSETGAVLGLNSRQTGSRLTRARDHLENAAAAVILARTGRAHCPDLSALLDSIEGPLPQQLRRRLTRHIIGCKECTEGRHRRVSSERLLDSVPVAFPPLSLRRRVAETCALPEQDARRTAAMAMAEGFDKNGFPPAGPERRARSERRGARDDRRTPVDLAPTPQHGTGAPHGETPRHGIRAEHAETPHHGTRAGHGDTPGRGSRAGHRDTPGRGTRAGHGDTPGRGSRAGYGETSAAGHDETAVHAAGSGYGEALGYAEIGEHAPRTGRGGAGRRGAKGARKASRKTTPVFATIACVLVATGAMVVATGQDASTPDGATQTLRFPSHTPGELQISYGPQPTDAPPSSEPPASPTAAATARRSPSPAAPGAPGATSAKPRTPAATRTPTRPAPTPAAKLVVSCPGALGDEDASVILISARNATIAWTASATGGLVVTPGQGVLKSGVKTRISVVVSEPEEAGEGTVTLRSAAGTASCPVTWDGQDPPPASDPPPDRQPTSEPTASATPSEESSGGPT